MSSIVPGYEYDIFISYRQNDNRSGWVSEFVKALQEELASTIKAPVSVYFDTNPHDGLLETHNVDKSLEGKLKCLIFIPIISQTYCDTTSFAWQHEFCAFNKLAKGDQFGSDIRLSNGNVASRILPVKIHDLDADDKSAIEKEIGTVLRSIDFIYREAGVNRPLNRSDSKAENQNKTDYRNQVNKVANAVKEVIAVLRNPTSVTKAAAADTHQKIQARPDRKRIALAAFVLALAIAAYFIYPNVTGSPTEEIVDKSIAVLPFVNMTSDPEQEYFTDGISEEVLNLLAKVPELKVIGRTSSFYFKGKNEDLRVIGEKLGAAYLLEGSVRKDGDRVRVTAQLIRAEDGVHLWSDTYERKLEKIFDLQDEIAAAVLKELKLKLLGPPASTTSRINNAEVYDLMLKGAYFFEQRETEKSYSLYTQALALDSGNAGIWAKLASIKTLQGNADYPHFHENLAQARKFAEKALEIDNNSSEAHRAASLVSFWYDFDWEKADIEIKKSLELEPGNSNALRNYGQLMRAVGRYQEADDFSVKSLDINPLNTVTIGFRSEVLNTLGRFDESIGLLKSGVEFNKDYIGPRLVQVYLATGRFDLALQTFKELPDDQQQIWSTRVWFAVGDKEKAAQAESEMLDLHSKKLVSSFDVAATYAFMKRDELALDYLEKAVDEKFAMVYVMSNLFLQPLHTTPRFQAVLKRMNLKEPSS